MSCLSFSKPQREACFAFPLALLLTPAVVFLAGCGGTVIVGTPPPPPAAALCGSPASSARPALYNAAQRLALALPQASYPGTSFSASVRAGASPIAGASISLFAAGTSGNGSTPVGLLSSQLTSAADGSVLIPPSYTCPAASSLLYLVSRGGTPAGASTSNPAAVFMTPLGTCSSITSASAFTLNEATTVASMAAFAQFYSPANGIGASSTNFTGLANAFATAATLADPASGAVPGSTMPSAAAAPTPLIDALANLINSCVVASSACSPIFNAVAGTATPPANTLDALYNLFHAPASSVATLFQLTQSSSAYAPTLKAAPSDWSVFITLSAAGVNEPSGIGVDSTGSVWVASYANSASKFSPIGAPVFPNGITGSGLSASYGLALDPADRPWIPNEPSQFVSGNSVSVFNPDGSSAAGAGGITGGGLNYPLAVAIDPNGTAWVVDYGDSGLTLLNPNGDPLSGASGYASSHFAFPVAVAIDSNHFGWVGNLSDTIVTKVAPDGSSFTPYNCCNGASGIAIDQSNNVWISNYYGDSVSAISCEGDIISNLAYTGDGSIDHPQGIAVDGAGSIWIANYRAPYLTELSGAPSTTPGALLTPTTGLGADAKLLEAYALALDSSGNIWVSNQGSSTVTKFVGLAVPVRTPLSGLPTLP